MNSVIIVLLNKNNPTADVPTEYEWNEFVRLNVNETEMAQGICFLAAFRLVQDSSTVDQPLDNPLIPTLIDTQDWDDAF